MKVLVTGAAGMLGRDVMLAAGNAGHDVVGFGRTELDVTDPARSARKLELERPDVVINCAAWTDVDGAEEAEEAAFAVNGTGAGNVAAAAAEVGASVVYVSSDYVFDGAKGAPYVETDQTGAALGLRPHQARRRGGDRRRQQAPLHRPLLLALRHRRLQLRRDDAAPRRRPRTRSLVVRDQVGSPTYTWHLAYGIVRLIEGIEFGIHHMAAAGAVLLVRVRPRDLRAGQGRVQGALDRPPRCSAARRRGPAFSALASQREHAIQLPTWQDGLAGYLAQRQARGGTA